ncbi:MAG TPA: phosphodiester glycosidase family protein [Chitinophagaceae bacterium]|nr:phosphodiester glycosidase family protein [Chitinophagaceae bacterium]
MAKSYCSLLFLLITGVFFSNYTYGQLKWQNADLLFQPLPSSVHIYYTEEKIDTSPFRAYYLVADLKDKKLAFTVDTSRDRRLTPSKFYERNNKALVVVNTTFFSYETNRSLNAVIKNGKLVAYNQHTIAGKGKDTFTYRHPLGSAIGISKKREVDVAWLYTDSLERFPYASQWEFAAFKDSFPSHDLKYYLYATSIGSHAMKTSLSKWKMQTAIGGGPVLLQNGEIKITNNEELKFAGKAINDKHPRTAIGYTAEGKLIILMVEGRNKNAGGATLHQLAAIFKDLGCQEALNLDGGGSSCMLVNGKETIKVSDAAGQRPVPAVFLIKQQ